MPLPLADEKEQERLAAYHSGLSDKQMAERFGRSLVTITQWRNRRGLPANRAVRRGLTDERRAERMQLYSMGHSDAHIARVQGLDTTAIREWRKSMNLPANARPIQNGPVIAGVEQERLEAYRSGLNDRQLSARWGTTITAVRTWRIKRDLPSNIPTNRLSKQHSAERLRLHSLGYSDAQMAQELGVTGASIRKWRCRVGLSSNLSDCPTRLSDEGRKERLHFLSIGYSDIGIAREQGVHRETIRKWRKRNNLLSNKSRVPEISLEHRARQKVPMLDRIMRALPGFLSPTDRDDAASEMFMAVMSGEIAANNIERAAKKVANRVFNQFSSKFGPRSLDEELGEDGGFRMLDMIRDERSSAWLEEMGATAW